MRVFFTSYYREVERSSRNGVAGVANSSSRGSVG